MNEQLRLFVTVTLCTAIWLGWQIFLGEPPQPVQAPGLEQSVADAGAEPEHGVSPGDKAEGAQGRRGAEADASARGAAADAGPGMWADEDAPTQQVATERYQGEFVGGTHAGFSSLYLPEFAAKSPVLAKQPLGTNEQNTDADAKRAAEAAEFSSGESLGTSGAEPQAGLHAVVGGHKLRLELVPEGERQLGTTPAAQGSAAPPQIVLRGRSPAGTQLEVTIEPAQDHYVWRYHWRLAHAGASLTPGRLDLSLALRPSVMDAPESKSFFSWFGGGSERVDRPQVVWQHGGAMARKERKDLASAAMPSGKELAFVGLELQYFLLAFVPDAGAELTAKAAAISGDGVSITASTALSAMAEPGVQEGSFQVFLGPKREAEMRAVADPLGAVIDYNLLGVPLGFLARPMMTMLRHFSAWTGSWGLAIMLLTLSVKTVLLPANIKSATSIKRMQKLKPELEVIKARHKDDPQAQQSATLALYREHSINPASGCLPVLLQIPVWLTLYRSLASAVDLYQQPFLWLTDLTAREPFPLLAIAAGGFTILQQKATPMAADNPQAKMLLWVMPGVVTMFMLNMPSGLVLYILVNSILTLAQQLVINRRVS